MKKKSITSKKARNFESDQSIEDQDWSESFSEKSRVEKPVFKKINLDLPSSMLQKIDKVAQQIGVSRQPLLKLWIHEKLCEELGRG